ncbi:hypothetical protein [Microbulbifer taiwanensis]|uniref:Uncharacterized protein n=1 Tax=Microbulbifer taiwanensis TaxID=986746 RepID=A0ABW1YRI2_9GAMM|nr:hypothetical protein [Microbulbifer taiwanensis]
MKFIQKITVYWKNRKKYPTFKDMPSWMLCILGGPSLLVSYYFGKHLAIPAGDEIIKVANEHGFNTLGITLSILVLVIGLYSMAFGAIATRCGQLLFQRHFV